LGAGLPNVLDLVQLAVDALEVVRTERDVYLGFSFVSKSLSS
jgi:hypothetical protein